MIHTESGKKEREVIGSRPAPLGQGTEEEENYTCSEILPGE